MLIFQIFGYSFISFKLQGYGMDGDIDIKLNTGNHER